jgi:cyclic pyranopterin phosphate synthase
VSDLTHLDAAGRARMVDVSGKDATARTAVAGGAILMASETFRMIVAGTAPKGDVLAAARLAGIMAAKRTAELIPLCHPLALTAVEIALRPDEAGSRIEAKATVRTTGPTGVEMEALTAVSVALLTIYDMAKAVDRAMRLTDIRLIHKSGGKSGTYEAPR